MSGQLFYIVSNDYFNYNALLQNYSCGFCYNKTLRTRPFLRSSQSGVLVTVRAGTYTGTNFSQVAAENFHILVDCTLEKYYAKNTPTWSRKEMESGKDYHIWNILHKNPYYSVLIFWKLLPMNVSMNEILQVNERKNKVINEL